MDTTPDAQLVASARQGDKEAFGRLADRYGLMAQHVAARMVADEDTARELAQEALLQAYLSLGHLKDDRAFRSWLYGIVLNICRSYIRDQKTVYFSLEAVAGGLQFGAINFSGAIPDPQQVAEEQDLQRMVWAAIEALSDANRQAALLFYYEQLSLQEIAGILGISVAAVKGRLFKARKQLREQLLAAYRELERETVIEERRIAMIKVTIADVIKQKQGDAHGTHHVVVLLDEAGRRILPIWVGPFEGEALAIGLREFPTPRPLTFPLMANLLRAAGAKVEEVRIEALKGETFYGIVKLRTGDTVREVDARPSDALALAVQMDSPIYASSQVLDRAGVALPQTGETAQMGKGLDDIIGQLEERWKPASTGRFFSQEEIDQAHRDLIAYLFGGGTD